MRKQTEYITTAWWDLKQTAEDLGVPISVVIYAKEQTKTNKRNIVKAFIQNFTYEIAQDLIKGELLDTHKEVIKRFSQSYEVLKGEITEKDFDKIVNPLRKGSLTTEEYDTIVSLSPYIEPIAIEIFHRGMFTNQKYIVQVKVEQGKIQTELIKLHPIKGDKASDDCRLTIRSWEEQVDIFKIEARGFR